MKNSQNDEISRRATAKPAPQAADVQAWKAEQALSALQKQSVRVAHVIRAIANRGGSADGRVARSEVDDVRQAIRKVRSVWKPAKIKSSGHSPGNGRSDSRKGISWH